MRIGFLVSLILVVLGANAHEIGRLNSIYTETAPVIDGELNDDVWNQSGQVSGFKTFVPDFGQELPFKTVAYWSHDEDNLYFAFKCYDDPELIKTSLAARDKIQYDDWVCINLDSFNDQQTLYGFYINPNGIQMDTRFAGNRDDPAIDMVWYSAGKIDEEGYTVEAKIPFKSIRYAVKDGKVDMGVIFERKVSRMTTQVTYPPLNPEQGFNFLTQSMPIHFENVKKNVLLELLPAVTYGRTKNDQEGIMVTDDQTELSLTAKYGITSNLILDATYNPDFSQVEADAVQMQVNQRFPVFFPEKRPFFQEGSENFNHSGRGNEIRSIVNTRTIANPISAGKLTGRIGAKNTISAVAAIDELDTSYNANVGVMRYKRTLSKDSYVGGFWTGRAEAELTNVVYGLDGQYRLSDASMLSGYTFNTYTDEAETDPVNAAAFAGNYSYRNRNVSVSAGVTHVSEDFRSTVGYITRTGITKYNAFYSPKFYPKSGAIKKLDGLVYFSTSKDHPSGLYERSLFNRYELTLPRNTEIRLSGGLSNEIYEALKFDRSNVTLSAESQLTKRIGVGGEYRIQRRPYYSDLEQGMGKSIEGGMIVQFSDNFNSETEYNYSELNSQETGENYYKIHIIRSKNTYQLNKYFFARAIIQYNSFTHVITPNLLASFTYIPGTVVHVGYGSFYDRTRWDIEAGDYVDSPTFSVKNQGVFFKASYLWRM
ncbi:MAG: carbohydrate binding family 9 domain-containing protein [Cyclobacteriaceae bacterium]